MYGLQCMHMTGDGYSSVLANIQAYVPGWESKSVAIKCYRFHLEKIVLHFPKYKGKGRLTQRAIKRLTTGARCAIKMQNKTGGMEQFRKDLLNGPSHVFCDYPQLQ